jgi:hypothetical protein
MNNKTIRILALTMAVLMVLCITGCGKKEEAVKIEPMEIEEVITYGFDYLGGKDVMPVSGYYGPMPTKYSYNGNDLTDNINDRSFKLLAEAGINHLSYTEWGSYSSSKATADNYFRLADKYGIAVTLNDSLQNYTDVNTADEFLSYYKKTYPNFVSVFVTDEPSGLDYFVSPDRELANYFTYFQVLNELDYFTYCNLYPIYDIKQKQQYDDYLERYLSNCHPKVLMFDHYPFNTANFTTYFYNIMAIREKAEKYKIPWWGFMASYEDTDKIDGIDEGMYAWSINTYLAYGAKGINIYLAMQNAGHVSDIANAEDKQSLANEYGLLGSFGQKTEYWYYNKNNFDHIRNFDHILMNSVNKGVLATGNVAKTYTNLDTKYILKGNSWREIKNITGDTITGCFNYYGKSAFYVVNASFEFAQKVTLDLHNEYKLTVFEDGKENKVETNQLKLDLSAGEGVLIVVD